MTHSSKSLVALLPLFLVILIDGMGLGLLFPILNSLVIDPASGYIVNMSATGRSILYGFIVGIFMLSWFFGAAILGDLSDSIGRKKSLMICLFGAFVGYLLSAFSIPLKSLTLLIVGRIIAGFTSGSQPIAQAAIIDVSSEEHKARNIGWILLAASIGFVIGPIVGGILTNSHLVSWFGFSAPLYFAALIALLNALMLWFTFEETHEQKQPMQIKFHHAVTIFISAFRHPAIRFLSLVLFVMLLGWSNYFSFISLFMFKIHGFNESWNSFFLAVMALGFGVGCYCVDWVTKLMPLKRVVGVFSIVVALLVSVLLMTSSVGWAWLVNFGVGVFLALAYSALLTLFSNQVGAEEQGWVMGVTGSVLALGAALTSFIGGPLANINVHIPLALTTTGMVISGLLVFFHVSKKNGGDA